MLASLIIPTRNKAAFLARTLGSIESQLHRELEIVIVDDGSEDSTRDVVRGFDTVLDVRYIRRAHRGRAAARNAAIRASRGELLIFCDDDRLTTPEFVGDHIAAHHGRDAPLVALGQQRGILTSWCQAWDLPIASLLARRPELASRLSGPMVELVTVDDVRTRFSEIVLQFEQPEQWWELHVAPAVAAFGPDLVGCAFRWTLGVTGNLSVTRAAAEAAGLFDENFVGWGLEDTDFHFRLERIGASTRVLAGGLNYHQLHERGSDHVREWGRNALRMLDKYDSLELGLYLRAIRQDLTFAEANQIALEHAAASTAIPALRAEVVRLTRDYFRLLARITL
jgi:glycosyltransferase involved in cell wall biosynthesis